MKFSVYCLICGVKKKYHKFETCGEEAKIHGLNLVGNFTAKNHIWEERPDVENIYGTGVVEDILKIQKEMRNMIEQLKNRHIPKI